MELLRGTPLPRATGEAYSTVNINVEANYKAIYKSIGGITYIKDSIHPLESTELSLYRRASDKLVYDTVIVMASALLSTGRRKEGEQVLAFIGCGKF